MNKIVIIIVALIIPFACFAEQLQLAKDANGWTVFSPSPESRIVYISSDGDDSTGQYYTSTSPEIGSDPFVPTGVIKAYSTYSAAYAQTRNGYPDWILFKRGDTFLTTIGNVKSGSSPDKPFVIGAYGGSGSMPVIKHGSSNGISVSRISSSYPSEARYMVLTSLRFYAHTRDPENSQEYTSTAGGVGFIFNSYQPGNSINGVLIEGCEFGYGVNNNLQAGGGSTIYDITVRRNKFLSNYPYDSHAQGLWAADVNGLVVEENIFDHNGWYSKSGEGGIGAGTIYNHNTYFYNVSNLSMKGNIFMRGCSMNNKFTSSTNSENVTIEENLYIGGHIGIGIGTNYTAPDRFKNIHIKNNVMTNLGMDNITGQGIAWYIQASGWSDGEIKDNLLMRSLYDYGYNGGIALDIWSDVNGCDISGNIIYRFEDAVGTKVLIFGGSTTMNFYDNVVSLPNGGVEQVVDIASGSGIKSLHDNTYYSSDGSNVGFRVNGTNGSFATFASAFSDTTSTFSEPTFPDATRSIETYMSSIGETATIDAFIAKCRAQDRYNWDTRFTAPVVNTYLRAGFFSDEPGPVSHIGRWRNFRFVPAE